MARGGPLTPSQNPYNGEERPASWGRPATARGRPSEGIRATCASRPSPVSACKIGELSIPELQSADPFSLFGDLCLAHQVAYLNGRKIRHLHGTPLVLFMKQTDCGTR